MAAPSPAAMAGRRPRRSPVSTISTAMAPTGMAMPYPATPPARNALSMRRIIPHAGEHLGAGRGTLRGGVELSDLYLPLVMAAMAVVAASAAVAGIHALRARPRRPRPGEPTLDLGPEPPAVAGLVAGGFEAPDEAVPATLLDLAARRWIDVESPGAGATLIRVRPGDRDGDLTAYERRVLDHVRGLADARGVVPSEALTTGPEAASDGWWKGFRREVAQDAARRGLVRPRWERAVVASLWAGVVGALILLWLAMQTVPEEEMEADPWILVAGFGALGLGVLAGKVSGSQRLRDTDQGLEVAGRWMGARRYLAEYGDFGPKPAASVTVWERYLAYAAALGLARSAVRDLPLGAEDHRHAWSRAAGEWRPVRVRYPRRRPGYGQHPAYAAAMGLALAVVATVVARWAADVWVPLALVPAAWGLWNLARAGLGVVDLGVSREVEGVVLRRRLFRPASTTATGLEAWWARRRERRYLAVDEGSGDAVAAWRVRPEVFGAVGQGDRVRASVTPQLGYVRAIESVATAEEPVAPEEAVEGTGASARELLKRARRDRAGRS